MMSGETDALNAHIFFPELVETVLEGVSRRCIHNVLWKSIPVCHHSLAEELHSIGVCRVKSIDSCTENNRL